MTFIEQLPYKSTSCDLIETMAREIVVIDGAMGTMIQREALSEDDFRGTIFADSAYQLKGCNDLLCLTRPDLIERIHLDYLHAGARIIETNSFNGNAVSLSDYGLSDKVELINSAAARVARAAANRFMAAGGAQCWVAGSIGPSNLSLSMAHTFDSQTPVYEAWNRLADTYREQCEALLRGGVDLLLIETAYDALNAKAAIYASRRAMERVGVRVPVIVSATLTESGRTLSGQTLEAFVASVAHGEPLAMGLNCSFGADAMKKYVDALQAFPYAVAVYPNAGLPNAMGCYDQSPADMAAKLEPMLASGEVNIVGGCCGTTPSHIAAIAQIASTYTPRRSMPSAESEMVLSGLEPIEVSRARNFINVGERCNVAGSRKFLRLVKEGNIDEAVDIARRQVESGAQIIDVNMDDALLDSEKEMASFLAAIGSEPDVARVPVMIDSSRWATIESALKCVQGRALVNSISLKEGEEVFLDHARTIREMGAAVVVMAFDEEGQAVTFERRTQVCQRAYRLLVDKVGFRGCDIVFDPNVLAVATGIVNHDRYAMDFLDTVGWIKANLPGAKVSGGVSNLSFSFRGNNYVREAMHSIFLYHAIGRGLDMAIVNASSMINIDDVEPRLAKAIDDLYFMRRPDATDVLVAMAAELKGAAVDMAERNVDVATASEPSTRLSALMVAGRGDGLEDLLAEVLQQLGSAVAVIDGPLMAGMNRVGELFGCGRLFLPQVVKSAQVMKQAVAWLTPHIEAERHANSSESRTMPRVVIATVKGDVHDIGKNIVGVMLGCNGYSVIDLGVMAEAEDIVSAAIEHNAQFVGVSGLITPSLEEMCGVARLMESRGLTIPLLVGGATTSALHTAVKIAPNYSSPVVHTRDAASLPPIMQRLLNPATSKQTIENLSREQSDLRQSYARDNEPRLSVEEALSRRPQFDYQPVVPTRVGATDMTFSINDVAHLINWRAFLSVWRLDPSLAEVAEIGGCDHCRAQWLAAVPTEKVGKAAEAMQLIKEAREALARLSRENATLAARVVILPAGSRDNDIVVNHEGTLRVFTVPRQNRVTHTGECLALSDYLTPASPERELSDYVTFFAVTSGPAITAIIDGYKEKGLDYKAILYQALADRLVEAATEAMHTATAEGLWGGASKGIRPAVGYPSLPDQQIIFEFDKVIDYASMGITLTETGAMAPAASTTGLIFTHPKARYFAI